MAELWFILIALMLSAYVVLDGFDIGAGILHLFIAKEPKQRDVIIRSIGPVWDGNEVWLLATGASILLAFPPLIAAGFSGFYLPLIMVLWLLMFRALGIELRHQFQHRLWREFWDVAFAGSSIALAVFFGAALGNVVRGVSMNDDGTFFATLFTNFHVDPEPGILDWYTVLVALLTVAALAHHGLMWLMWRIDDEMSGKYRKLLLPLWSVTAVLTLAVTAATFWVQPRMSANLADYPAFWLAPAGALIGLGAAFLNARKQSWGRAAVASSVYLAGMLVSAAAAVYPYALPGRGEHPGLSIFEAQSSAYSLRVALVWWIPGILIAIGYFVFTYRKLETNLNVTDGDEH